MWCKEAYDKESREFGLIVIVRHIPRPSRSEDAQQSSVVKRLFCLEHVCERCKEYALANAHGTQAQYAVRNTHVEFIFDVRKEPTGYKMNKFGVWTPIKKEDENWRKFSDLSAVDIPHHVFQQLGMM
jgi:hypothetical protein